MTSQGAVCVMSARIRSSTTSLAADQCDSASRDSEYDRFGSWLVRIGNMGIDYDMAGSRVRRVGGSAVDYDRRGTRPRYLRADGEALIDDRMCVIVFLVLVAFDLDA